MFFTVDERNRIRDSLVAKGRADPRIVSAALVGSSAEEGDRWSDLDLTYGLSKEANVTDVLSDWTDQIQKDFNAVPLFDLEHSSTIYRVFLFPGNLQVDLSFSPGSEFGPSGPRFKLLFGSAVTKHGTLQLSAQHLFGLAVHHVLRGTICLERGRLWQAEYWLSEARNEILTLACLNHGLDTAHGRGFDGLPPEILDPFKDTLASSLDRGELLRTLRRMIDCLVDNSGGLPNESLVAQLRELAE